MAEKRTKVTMRLKGELFARLKQLEDDNPDVTQQRLLERVLESGLPKLRKKR